MYEALYKGLPQNTIAEKIIRLRKMHNLEREEFADLLKYHLDTVLKWEVHNIMPKPQSIKIVCDSFNIPLSYFHDYYIVYYSSPNEVIKQWKIKNNYTYSKAIEILNITHSNFGRVLSGKVHLSYELYIKFKELGVF